MNKLKQIIKNCEEKLFIAIVKHEIVFIFVKLTFIKLS